MSPAGQGPRNVPELYDDIGTGYAARRRADPRIAADVHDALGEARTVVNVGAGAGSYEPTDRVVVAIEPSVTMIAQRPRAAAPAVIAHADALPFVDGAFDAAMTVLSVHHWPDPRAGVAEMRRVARDRVVVLTFDPATCDESWLVRHYAPELSTAAMPCPSPAEIAGWLGDAAVRVVPVPADCADGFLMSFWNRPEAVRDPDALDATSGFARLPQAVRARIVGAVERDLASGLWDCRFGHLRRLDAFDAGLRLVVARDRVAGVRGTRAR